MLDKIVIAMLVLFLPFVIIIVSNQLPAELLPMYTVLMGLAAVASEIIDECEHDDEELS